ncbi:MAG: bifunctional diaminohydroxyphosphoribosylaminopyrimidine deaminase/5-amino-6-(5-phosphoribosylamino)uracil reductase RibD [Ferruginibacter sp.]|nr:bifunctional diaminohydroxyphosphoribosylaminopyrimidine deaminase/5-amino-6-(5-phosphoribosylamino)uracil reductase RibD [Chitinophagaceae bacterium]MBP6286178.1 bifunctional diaminohydroxyphosphoribosylaminopyrimidine deaminase/5-amino-6-(5-phosphoribosylamino)uracil reductase RibD [Ferruginibacter sp.]MBU9935228.1 bifunctional diaminohydroxyphosphoribosylaminopyrimidine deaminase/5-amino-6-(5-phosphoribosylamino)uracil reductase RibD [Ferruginibacter sp.]
MQRCLQLAGSGAGHTAPNPMVGAVLVYKDSIIGEGYHRQYGEAHAEVNCINSVCAADKELIARSILYVSLEPCAHFGKTPPCTGLIIENKIPAVVIGCRDSFNEVNGKGIEKLEAAGIQVTVGVLEKESLALNRRFFTFHDRKRPYIIVKWAQSSDGKIAGAGTSRILISNEFSNRLVHKWRSEEAAILVGKNTALRDDPSLTTRHWPGKSPVRLVIDKELKLPAYLKLFDGSGDTIIFNYLKTGDEGKLHYQQLGRNEDLLKQLLLVLYERKLQSVIVEGGTKLLQSFIDAGLWDEARVLCNRHLTIGNGPEAPVLKNMVLLREEKMDTDVISYFTRQANPDKE